MTRDPIFYQFFEDLPGCFFELIGRPAGDAAHYDFDAIEYKKTSVRLDGLFLPHRGSEDVAYILEVQYYQSERVYANLMSKIGWFLEHRNPGQDWIAVVIYPDRSMEQKNLQPYECLIQSRQLIRIYLDQLPPARPGQFEMGALQLIAAKPEAALEKARAMIPQVRASKRPKQFQRMMIQFIETVILYQFPQWSRREIEKMLQVSDVRKTRVFQEALEEGLEKGEKRGEKRGEKKGKELGVKLGEKRGEQKGRAAEREAIAAKLLETELPIDEIAKATGLTVTHIRKLQAKKPNGSGKSQ